MELAVHRVEPDAVVAMRDLYRHEMHCQIIHDSWHSRGWVDCYLLSIDGRGVGYGLVGSVPPADRDTVTEFYVVPMFRGAASPLFRRLVDVSNAANVELQSNDRLFTLMLYDTAEEIERHAVLFEDRLTTQLPANDGHFRRATEAEKATVFPHHVEPVGDWVIEVKGEIVATGGILFHYNVPYGDMYMEVAEPFRRRGHGSYLIQELKRTAYEMGRIPAARCGAQNVASRATLQKAGMLPCARMLVGKLRRSNDAGG